MRHTVKSHEKSADAGNKTAARLTIRAPEDLERRIRSEAARRGLSVNQMMLNILCRHIRGQRV